MNTLNKEMEKLFKKAINQLAEKEAEGWPPECATFLFQPIRPQKDEQNKHENIK